MKKFAIIKLMRKEIIIIVAVFLVLFGGLFLVYKTTQGRPAPSLTLNEKEIKERLDRTELVYFYGTTCPYCMELNKWLGEKKVADKVDFEKLEVYNNRDNSLLMERAAGICKLDPRSIGVPFVYKNGECFMGLPESQKAFEQALRGK